MLRRRLGVAAAALLAAAVALAGCAPAPSHPARSGVSIQLDALGVSAASADDPRPTRVDFDDGGEAVLAYLIAYLGDPEPVSPVGCGLTPWFAWPDAGVELRLPPAGLADEPPLVLASTRGALSLAFPGLREAASDVPVISTPGGVVLGATLSQGATLPGGLGLIEGTRVDGTQPDPLRNSGERSSRMVIDTDTGGVAMVLESVDGVSLGRPYGVVADVGADARVLRLRAPSGLAEPRC